MRPEQLAVIESVRYWRDRAEKAEARVAELEKALLQKRGDLNQAKNDMADLGYTVSRLREALHFYGYNDWGWVWSDSYAEYAPGFVAEWTSGALYRDAGARARAALTAKEGEG